MITTYAAAPLSAATLHERVELDRRARQFVAMLAQNLLVVSPHDRARIVEGYPVEPEHDRGEAMAWCLAEVARIRGLGGRMDVLLREDRTLSAGCAEEVALWRKLGGEPWAWRMTLNGRFLIVGCP